MKSFASDVIKQVTLLLSLSLNWLYWISEQAFVVSMNFSNNNNSF